MLDFGDIGKFSRDITNKMWLYIRINIGYGLTLNGVVMMVIPNQQWQSFILAVDSWWGDYVDLREADAEEFDIYLGQDVGHFEVEWR